jgi:hypothetical protein
MTQNPFLIYIRRTLIFDKPSSADLIRILDNKISDIKSIDARVDLLNEINSLWQSNEIDIYYKGGIMDFKSYVDYRLAQEIIEKKTDWYKLYNDLKIYYIKGISASDFNQMMNYNALPKDATRVIWRGKRNEGYAFSKHFGFTLTNFKKCFVPEDGKEFRNNDNTPIKLPFESLLNKYKKR